MKFDYGKNGLEISINPNWNVSILRPVPQKRIENPILAIKHAIQNPLEGKSLKSIIKEKKPIEKVCIVIDDATRPVPSHFILKALIEDLNNYGILDSQIFILIATGLHRKSNENEIERMVGKELSRRITIVNHQSTDSKSVIFLGKTKHEIPIYINKYYYESDLRIISLHHILVLEDMKIIL